MPSSTLQIDDASGAPRPLGPVSAALQADLREWVRRHGVVVWLDLDGSYSSFVDRLIAARGAGALDYEIRALRGSFLELLMSLEDVASGTEKVPLVVHVPGHNEEAIKSTPLLELYSAGVRYRKNLETLVTEAAAGKVSPEGIDAFKADGDICLKSADEWLEAMTAGTAWARCTSLPSSPSCLTRPSALASIRRWSACAGSCGAATRASTSAAGI